MNNSSNTRLGKKNIRALHVKLSSKTDCSVEPEAKVAVTGTVETNRAKNDGTLQHQE